LSLLTLGLLNEYTTPSFCNVARVILPFCMGFRSRNVMK
jgi:hypothetical protein